MATVPLGANNVLINKPVLDILEEMRVNPIAILANIAMGKDQNGLHDEDIEIDHVLSAAKELTQYIQPKKRSFDVNAKVSGNVTYNVVQFSAVMPDAALKLQEDIIALQSGRMGLTGVETKQMMKEVPTLDAATIEAMRIDVDKLPVVDGITDIDYVPGKPNRSGR